MSVCTNRLKRASSNHHRHLLTAQSVWRMADFCLDLELGFAPALVPTLLGHEWTPSA